MTHFLVGTDDKTPRYLELLPDSFLLIDDGELAESVAVGRTTVLDFSAAKPPRFNILSGAGDHDTFARSVIALFDTVFPEGATTLTRRTENYLLLNCLRLLLLKPKATLLDIPRVLTDLKYRADDLLPRCDDPVVLDNWAFINSWDEKDYRPLIQKISGLLTSPLIREVLCHRTDTFNLPTNKRIVAKLDRAKIGDFNAFFIGAVLMSIYQGQLIVPDFGFYGREIHTQLIRQERLICGVNVLAELSPKLQQVVLSIPSKTAFRTTLEDAERLVVYFPRITKPSQITGLEAGETLEC